MCYTLDNVIDKLMLFNSDCIMKITKTIHSGGLCKSRKIIKSFKTEQAGHEFLNKQPNNDWQIYEGELKAGKYAFAGGNWHNVKSLDSSVLAHI